MPRVRQFSDEEWEEIEAEEARREAIHFFRHLYGQERADAFLRTYDLLPSEG